MPKYLNRPRGPTIAIGVCDRCKIKHYLYDLKPDRDSPGLRVCDPCNDLYDPWKLPARETEDISLENPRPDERLR